MTRALWTGAILAGGAATRFGGEDKSALVVGGRTILERQLASLRSVVGSILLITNDPSCVVPPDVQIVGDEVRGAGAIGGLFTALARAPTPWTLVVACDMPFVTAPFLAHLCAIAESGDADVVIPRTHDGVQPLCAAYARRVVGIVRRQIDSQSLKMRDVLAHVRVREVGPTEIDAFDKGNSLFLNINSPEDYRRAIEVAEMQQ